MNHPCDRQTDGRTDRRNCDSICALSIDAVARKNRTAVIVSAKLHYTDTGYGHVVQHHQRTSSQQFYNLLYNKFKMSCGAGSRRTSNFRLATFVIVIVICCCLRQHNGQKFATSQHLHMSRCCALALRCGKFVIQQVVELL